MVSSIKMLEFKQDFGPLALRYFKVLSRTMAEGDDNLDLNNTELCFI